MNRTSSVPDMDGGIAIYHVVYAHENFEKSAHILHEMIRDAARDFPGKPRTLYLDIEGHRNSAGGFDHDMHELQGKFILGFLSPYLTEIHTPLLTEFGEVARPQRPQRDDVPDELNIRPAEDG